MTDIHPQLKQDCIQLGRFPLSHLLLMNDANFPWFILVPDRDDITEIYQLPPEDQQQLLAESSFLGQALMGYFKGDKLNIGALGNMVPQLHLHHIVRYRDDAAWPAPVWGRVPAQCYEKDALDHLIAELKPSLQVQVNFAV
jgi:diadenosine tetraphosphate (Ap4A) HIT family hydrolase